MAGFFKKILSKFSKDKIDWDDLEESLITGDLGVKLSMQIIDNLQDKKKSINPDDIISACKEEEFDMLSIQRVSEHSTKYCFRHFAMKVQQIPTLLILRMKNVRE